MKDIHSISIIGSGCVGSFLAQELFHHGFSIKQIIARNEERAKDLAEKVDSEAVFGDMSNFDDSSDLYIMALKDEVILELRNHFLVKDKILVHTSGSVPMNVFHKASSNYGVFYPLQTIIKDYHLRISDIPFFITANNEDVENILFHFAKKLSPHVQVISDDLRTKLHLAAVFASNFTNYQLKLAKDIMDANSLDFSVLKPLVDEVINRAFRVGPVKSQTGPAKRGDCAITDKHLEMLNHPDQKELYALISKMIREDFKKSNKK